MLGGHRIASLNCLERARSPLKTRTPPTSARITPQGDPVPATLAEVLHALSDPVRLHIVRLAADAELACCEFGLDLPKATLSHHFKVLRTAGIITVREQGTRHLTTLNRAALDARFPGLIGAVLTAAD